MTAIENSGKILGTDGKQIVINPDTGQLEKAPDPLLEAVKLNWNDLAYLHECYQMFLTAVQLGAAKDYRYNGPAEYAKAGSPKWNENDSFYNWVNDEEPQLEMRLDELQKKLATGSRLDSHLLHLADSGVIEDTHPFFGKQMDATSFEALEFIIRKSMEALSKFKKHKYTMKDIRSYRAH